MRMFDTVADYAAEKGKEIGVSDWVEIDQDRINQDRINQDRINQDR